MKPKVGVYPAEEVSRRARLWEALSALYSLDFVPASEASRDETLCGLVICCNSRKEAMRLAGPARRFIAYIDSAPLDVKRAARVTTSDSSHLRPCLRRRTLPDESLNALSAMREEHGDQVFARVDGALLWAGCAGLRGDLVALPAPQLAEKEYLFEHFRSERWAQLLPLLHFAQEVSGWRVPPVRAALMFDDPNLHWRSYGYIDYRQLSEDAAERNYHVSFATIPLDSWFVHARTAALFRSRRDRVSLCIHGNNHTYYELSEVPDDARRLALAAQALQRTERFEAASGLDVSRVMAAPHGACNHRMADALRRTGFEAACISRSSLMIRNPGTSWPITIGMTPAEFLGGGLPVYPRYNIRWDDTYPIFSAFLGQPVVPVGHHADVADDLGLVRRNAEVINSLGEVQWMNLQSLARTNFLAQRVSEVLHLRMFSRRITIDVPEGVTRILLERPWKAADGEELTMERDLGQLARSNGAGPTFAVSPGEKITLSSVAFDTINRAEIPSVRTPLWAVARRQLCEGRDRLRPAVDRLFTHKNGQ